MKQVVTAFAGKKLSPSGFSAQFLSQLVACARKKNHLRTPRIEPMIPGFMRGCGTVEGLLQGLDFLAAFSGDEGLLC